MAKVNLTNAQKTASKSRELTDYCKRLLRFDGITQAQVADYVGCSPREVSYELNHEMSLKVFIAISQLTGRELISEKKDL